jgi:hypothetical protein
MRQICAAPSRLRTIERFVKKGDTVRTTAMHARSTVWIGALLALSGCGAPDSPEAQVRKIVDRMEAAAEHRSTSDMLELVSDHYQDEYGGSKQEASQYLRGYFITNQSIHLLTRVNSIEFPIPEEARVKVSVGMLGREAEAAGNWNLAADLYDFDVTLKLEDGDWKVAYAKWKRP